MWSLFNLGIFTLSLAWALEHGPNQTHSESLLNEGFNSQSFVTIVISPYLRKPCNKRPLTLIHSSVTHFALVWVFGQHLSELPFMSPENEGFKPSRL